MPWISIFTGKSGFAASSTAEDVTKGIDGTGLTAIVTAKDCNSGGVQGEIPGCGGGGSGGSSTPGGRPGSSSCRNGCSRCRNGCCRQTKWGGCKCC